MGSQGSVFPSSSNPDTASAPTFSHTACIYLLPDPQAAADFDTDDIILTENCCGTEDQQKKSGCHDFAGTRNIGSLDQPIFSCSAVHLSNLF